MINYVNHRANARPVVLCNGFYTYECVLDYSILTKFEGNKFELESLTY